LLLESITVIRLSELLEDYISLRQTQYEKAEIYIIIFVGDLHYISFNWVVQQSLKRLLGPAESTLMTKALKQFRRRVCGKE
jgi:hypothetical protein